MTTFKRVMSEKRGLIWPLALVLLANAVVFAIVVYPLSQKVASGQQEADAANIALVNARRDYANARATVTGKAQADTELQKFYGEVLPPDLSGARRITFLPIEQLAQETNLRIGQRNSDYSAIRESGLSKFTQTAVLTGEYRDIRQFIHRLETRPEFIVIENIGLSQDARDAARGITVTLQIATYFRTGADGD